ncbi:MAG: hypothetical protein ACOYOQ_01970 [Microthrixaceae bacterium]
MSGPATDDAPIALADSDAVDAPGAQGDGVSSNVGGPPAVRPPRPLLGALAWCAAGAVALMSSGPLSDNSFLTHLATGRLLQERGLPSSNPFLFTGGDFPVPSWWFSGALAVAEDLGGGTAIRLLVVAVGAALGVVLVALARPERRDVAARSSLPAVLVPVALVIVTLAPFTTPRPHLVGFLLLGVALVLWRDDRSAWWMVPVFATWVNVHGTWLYGLGVLVLLAGCASLERRRPVRILPVAAAALGVVIGGLLYPERLRLVVLPFEQFGDERAREAISAYQEWAPAGWAHPLTWAVVLLGAAAVVALVRSRRWPSVVVAVLLVGLGMSAGRLLPVAAISLLPWASAAFAGTGPGLGSRRVAVPVRVGGVALLLVAVAGALRGPSYDLDRYPVAAVDWLEERGLVADPDLRVVSHIDVGNYLVWRFGTEANAFADDRPSVDAMLDHRSLDQARPDWALVLERVDPDVVVFRDDKPLVPLLDGSGAWPRAATIDGFAVYCAPRVRDRCG